MLRAAAIGLGWWADELTQAVQGKSEKIQVTACYSRSVETRARFGRRYDAAVHESYAALLADENIDAVLLCTPHSRHAEQVEQAARAGKHVFVEKPFTLTEESGRAAAAICAEAGRVLAVGQNRRFAAATREVKRMLEAGEFGTPLHCEANFSNPRPLSYSPDGWRADRTESPGVWLQVIAYDPYLPPWTAKEYRVTLVPSLEELASRSDFVSRHLGAALATPRT